MQKRGQEMSVQENMQEMSVQRRRVCRSTAPAQGNQSLSRELRASALCPGLEAQFHREIQQRQVRVLEEGRGRVRMMGREKGTLHLA